MRRKYDHSKDERVLWLTVIERAIYEAKESDRKVRQAAIDWLMRDDDFPRVCEMAGIENGEPHFVVVQLTISKDQGFSVVPRFVRCPGDGCSGEHARWVVAQFGTEEVAGQLHQLRVSRTDAELVHALIAAEEGARPDRDGGPIDIVTLDATGAHWAKGGSCSAN